VKTKHEYLIGSLAGGFAAGVVGLGLAQLFAAGTVILTQGAIWLVLSAATVFGLYCGIDYRQLTWESRGGAWIALLVAIRELCFAAFFFLAALAMQWVQLLERLELVVLGIAGLVGEKVGQLAIRRALRPRGLLGARIEHAIESREPDRIEVR
jgi:hypothetical protein